ncbi:MAG: hypothetical protein K0R81_766 [Microbacterium sp.]|nr:hypothetical protein [Microbacterium sp.]
MREGAWTIDARAQLAPTAHAASDIRPRTTGTAANKTIWVCCRDRRRRVDEGREERGEDDGDLRVGHAHDHGSEERSDSRALGDSPRRRGGCRVGRPPCRCDGGHPERHQHTGPEIAHDLDDDRGLRDQDTQPEGDEEAGDQCSRGVARRAQEGRCASSRQRSADDEDHARAGHEDEEHRRRSHAEELNRRHGSTIGRAGRSSRPATSSSRPSPCTSGSAPAIPLSPRTCAPRWEDRAWPNRAM